MVPKRVLKLLFVALSVSSSAQALNLARIGIPIYGLTKREPSPQATGGDDEDTPKPTETAAVTSDEITSSTSTSEVKPDPKTEKEETTTSTQTTTKEPENTLTETTKIPPIEEPTPDPTTTKAVPPPIGTTTATAEETTFAGTTKVAATSTSETSEPSESQTPTTITYTTIRTTTMADGIIMTTEEVATSTGVATLSEDGGGTSGMSSGTRNTIIGVVVGVGGAILLSAIGFAAWRIRGRKRKAEEHDGLIGYGGYTAGAAETPNSFSGQGSASMASRTPFQSTLESYHAPTQVNQASNF